MTIQQEIIELTGREKAILMGTILGDATMQKRGNSYRLRIAQSIIHNDYTVWLQSELARLCTSSELKSFTNEKGNVTEYFYLRSGDYLKPLYDLFYKLKIDESQVSKVHPEMDEYYELDQQEIIENKKYRKTITKETIKNLPVDPILLAVWFMDDGTVRNDCYAGKICSQGFNLTEHNLLISYLRNYKIEASANFQSVQKQQYYLSINAQNFGYLTKEIAPTVKQVPCMMHKLNEERRKSSKYWKNLKI
jgi:LAGLIDADG DNA endonuclease family